MKNLIMAILSTCSICFLSGCSFEVSTNTSPEGKVKSSAEIKADIARFQHHMNEVMEHRRREFSNISSGFADLNKELRSLEVR